MEQKQNSATYRAGLRDVAERAKAILSGVAAGGSRSDADKQIEYKQMRNCLIKQELTASRVPAFVKSCRELQEFWSFIKPKYSTYKERIDYIREAFEPLLSHLESLDGCPGDSEVTGHLTRFDYEEIQAIWSKAIDRKRSDPEGAITAARTLLESTIKHILDELRVSYDPAADLPRLYHLMAEQLKLAPSQHTELIYKQILGGCKSVVEGLGSVRSKLGDAHGKGKNAPKPSVRHAELSVNIAGAVAVFLLQTWEERNKGGQLDVVEANGLATVLT